MWLSFACHRVQYPCQLEEGRLFLLKGGFCLLGFLACVHLIRTILVLLHSSLDFSEHYEFRMDIGKEILTFSIDDILGIQQILGWIFNKHRQGIYSQ